MNFSTPFDPYRKPGFWLAVCVASLFFGACSQPGAVDAIAPASAGVGLRGGTVQALPNNQGYAEIVVEPASTSSSGNGNAVLAVYLLQTDMKSPLDLVPDEVSATVTTPDDPTPKPVALSKQPIEGKSDTSSRYASTPGPFDYDELRGQVSISLKGETSRLDFSRQ